jgi:Fe-coproporphyrin III synthase
MNQLDAVYLHVTKACNLDCIYCYFSAGYPEDDELSTKEMAVILEDICNLEPNKIVFTGGEPLLRDDLIELAQICKAFNANSRLALTTNGSLIDQNNAAELVQNFHDIRISIDGPEEINDRLRGSGSFRKAMNACELIINNGGNPQAFITVTAFNQVYLESLIRLLLSRQIFNLHFSPVKPAGRAENMALIADEEQLTATITCFFVTAQADFSAIKHVVL